MNVEDRIRFLDKVDLTNQDGCWLWQGGFFAPGYGRFWLNGKNRLAHRVMYIEYVEWIPSEVPLDHLCRVHACVNFHHLEAVTTRENLMRSPLAPAAINARRTHCVHGHPFTGDNLVIDYVGKRRCRECRRRRDREAKRRIRAAARS